jgi:pimeloyl-ACP methyl ester carboxylesterase
MTDPIVFVPGLMQDARSFLPQMVGLGTQRAVQVVLPVADTVERNSEAVLAGAPARFALAGHGLGGIVALDVIRRAPDRVSSVIFLATDPLAEAPQMAAAREARMIAARSGRLLQAMSEEVPVAALFDGDDRSAVLALAEDMALGLGEGVFLRQSRALQRRPDQQKTLRRTLLPALFLAGAFDTVVPLRRQEFARDLMPNSVLKVLEHAGHLPMLESPEEVTRAIEQFLSGPMILR